MNTEDKMLLLETMITNIAIEHCVQNEVSPTAARYIMLGVYNRFQTGMVDDMLRKSLAEKVNTASNPESDGNQSGVTTETEG
jgi:hypothetical protein